MSKLLCAGGRRRVTAMAETRRGCRRRLSRGQTWRRRGRSAGTRATRRKRACRTTAAKVRKRLHDVADGRKDQDEVHLDKSFPAVPGLGESANVGGAKHSLAEHVVRDVQQALGIIEQVKSKLSAAPSLPSGPQPGAERSLQQAEMLQPVAEDAESEDSSREALEAGAQPGETK
eukprot:763224-Hanusia_phi.AAC.2